MEPLGNIHRHDTNSGSMFGALVVRGVGPRTWRLGFRITGFIGLRGLGFLGFRGLGVLGFRV